MHALTLQWPCLARRPFPPLDTTRCNNSLEFKLSCPSSLGATSAQVEKDTKTPGWIITFYSGTKPVAHYRFEGRPSYDCTSVEFQANGANNSSIVRFMLTLNPKLASCRLPRANLILPQATLEDITYPKLPNESEVILLISCPLKLGAIRVEAMKHEDGFTFLMVGGKGPVAEYSTQDRMHFEVESMEMYEEEGKAVGKFRMRRNRDGKNWW